MTYEVLHDHSAMTDKLHPDVSTLMDKLLANLSSMMFEPLLRFSSMYELHFNPSYLEYGLLLDDSAMMYELLLDPSATTPEHHLDLSAILYDLILDINMQFSYPRKKKPPLSYVQKSPKWLPHNIYVSQRSTYIALRVVMSLHPTHSACPPLQSCMMEERRGEAARD